MKYLLLLLLLPMIAKGAESLTIDANPFETPWTIFDSVSLKISEVNKEKDLQQRDLFSRVHTKYEDLDNGQNFNNAELY